MSADVPGTWLFKTEPGEYAFQDLVREKRTVWSGVSSNQALKYLRGVRKGDEVLVYHTGSEKAVVGIARVVRGAYPDPDAGDERLVVVDLAPVRLLDTPVTLAALKARADLADFPLVRLPRLSVMPVRPGERHLILGMAGGHRKS